MRITSNTINFPDEVLADMWNTIDWNATEEKVLKWQKQLSIAAFKNNKENIKKLSIRIVSSIEAKTLAVHKVSEVLKSSPGIDNIRWIKASDKMRAAISLSPYNYKSKPFKRFVITDARSNKERRIGIPSMYDRAMQVLYCMALEPISEATADRKSFAFRKGRSALDAHALIMDLLKEPNAPEWFLICDVQSCYDSISHKWLLDNIPISRHVLKQFIEAGIVFNNEIFPVDTGISLGCNISPMLGNMTLDGIQKLLYDLQEDQANIDYLDGYTVRFADDICVAARSKETAEKYLDTIKVFLAARGLVVSPKKTHIEHISTGFDFLSRFYCRINGHVYCIPSEKAVKNFEKDLEDLILNPETKWSQKKLIQSVNAKLHGWASYHRVEESMETFKHIDVIVSVLLLKLMKSMYPQKTNKMLINKFWYKDSQGRQTFTLTTNKNIQVINLADVVLVEHQKINTKKNIFLDSEYFVDRLNSQEVTKVSGKYKAVWDRQNGKCSYCDKPISPDQPRKIIYKKLSKDKSIRNMAYVHEFCVDDEIVLVDSDLKYLRDIDVYQIVHDIQNSDENKKRKRKSIYENLFDYFANCSKHTFAMQFDEIEKILGFKLCKSAYNHTCYWYRKGSGLFSNCWLDNGYVIQKLYLDKTRVVFKREKKKCTKLNIPSSILSSKLPNSAKYELEQFFEYVIKKYGL
jgi:RNA-directed DNA polymerase